MTEPIDMTYNKLADCNKTVMIMNVTNGTVKINPDIPWDDAAKEFWTYIANTFYMYETTCLSFNAPVTVYSDVPNT